METNLEDENSQNGIVDDRAGGGSWEDRGKCCWGNTS